MKSPLFPVLFLGLLVSGTAPSPTPQTAQNPVRLPAPLTAGAELRDFLSHMEIVHLPDGLGGTVKTIRLHGVNLQIVSGSGTTDSAVDGTGNLIVGYNELRPSDNDRSGSHNLIVGKEHNFSSFGSFVAGRSNIASGQFSSVSGGSSNTASGNYSSVSGGKNRSASGTSDWVAGTLFEDQ